MTSKIFNLCVINVTPLSAMGLVGEISLHNRYANRGTVPIDHISACRVYGIFDGANFRVQIMNYIP